MSLGAPVYGENEIQTVPGGATIQILMSNLESVSTQQNMMGMLEPADNGVDVLF